MILILLVIDAVIVIMTFFYLFERFFSQKPLVIFIKGLLGTASGFVYQFLSAKVYYSDASIFIKMLLLFAPILFLLGLFMKDYFFNDRGRV